MTSSDHENEDRIVDLKDLIETGLGHPVSQQSVRLFAEYHARFESKQTDLATRSADHLISRQAYVAELDKLMRELSSVGEEIFGFDNFHKVFGQFRVQNLFDPQAFIAEDRALR